MESYQICILSGYGCCVMYDVPLNYANDIRLQVEFGKPGAILEDGCLSFQ